MTKFKLTQSQIEKLESISPKLNGLEQSLKPFANESILAEVREMQNIMKDVFAKYWEDSEVEEESEFDALNKIGDEHNLQTVWSNDIKAKDLGKYMPSKVKTIHYNHWDTKTKIEVSKAGKKITWLEAWKFADQLIAQAGYGDHIYVESFTEDKKNPGHYYLFVGS